MGLMRYRPEDYTDDDLWNFCGHRSRPPFEGAERYMVRLTRNGRSAIAAPGTVPAPWMMPFFGADETEALVVARAYWERLNRVSIATAEIVREENNDE